MEGKKATAQDGTGRPAKAVASDKLSPDKEKAPKNGSWQRIEALRERAALKASLADVWDDDFDLDEEILAELDHTAEFFTTQADPEEDILGDDDDIDEYFDDEDV